MNLEALDRRRHEGPKTEGGDCSFEDACRCPRQSRQIARMCFDLRRGVLGPMIMYVAGLLEDIEVSGRITWHRCLCSLATGHVHLRFCRHKAKYIVPHFRSTFTPTGVMAC